MQSETWLSVCAHTGFHLLWENHDITISRQQITNSDLGSDRGMFSRSHPFGFLLGFQTAKMFAKTFSAAPWKTSKQGSL